MSAVSSNCTGTQTSPANANLQSPSVSGTITAANATVTNLTATNSTATTATATTATVTTLNATNATVSMAGALTLAAGTTALAPLKFQSGVPKTSPAVGDVEFATDGLFVSQIAGSHAAVPLRYYAIGQSTTVDGTGTGASSAVTPQSFLIAPALSVGVGTYRFRGAVDVVTTSALTTPRTWQMQFTGTSTISTLKAISYVYDATAVGDKAVVLYISGTGAKSYTPSSGVSSQTQVAIQFEGVMDISAAGTIVPKIASSAQLSGSANVTFCGNGFPFFEMELIGPSGTTRVGGWA